MYIFSYGSLIVPDSASAALGRPVAQDELKEAVLTGFKRYWGGFSPIIFKTLGDQVVNGAFYDILSINDSFTMGVVMKVDRREMDELCIREKHYNLLDITHSVYAKERLDGPIYTFVMKPEHRINDDDPDTYIPQKYEARIEESARRRGDHFFENFIYSTLNSPLRRIEGDYTFADVEQQKRV